MESTPNTMNFAVQSAAIQGQELYLRLINNRSAKIDDDKHKELLLSGYTFIHRLMNKADFLTKMRKYK